MNDLVTTIANYWPIFVAVSGLFIWGLRLEGLVKLNKKEIEHIHTRVDTINNDVKVSLAKLDARMDTVAQTLERIIWRLPSRRESHDDDK